MRQLRRSRLAGIPIRRGPSAGGMASSGRRSLRPRRESADSPLRTLLGAWVDAAGLDVVVDLAEIEQQFPAWLEVADRVLANEAPGVCVASRPIGGVLSCQIP
jgi:hypothetical protein